MKIVIDSYFISNFLSFFVWLPDVPEVTKFCHIIFFRAKNPKSSIFSYKHVTLVSLIIVQDGINVQAGKISKINKRAGWNKAVQVGFFHFLLVKIKVLS